MYVKVGFTTSVGLKLGAALKAIPLICVVVLGALRRIFFSKNPKQNWNWVGGSRSHLDKK